MGHYGWHDVLRRLTPKLEPSITLRTEANLNNAIRRKGCSRSARPEVRNTAQDAGDSSLWLPRQRPGDPRQAEKFGTIRNHRIRDRQGPVRPGLFHGRSGENSAP